MASRHFRNLVTLTLALFSVLILSLGCTVAQDDGSLSRVRSSGKLTIGIDPSYPPLAALDAQGRPVGYEIDLATAISERIGVSPDFVSIDVGGIVDALLARKIDVIVAGLSPDAGYGRRVVFSRPYFNDGQIVIAREAYLTNLSTLSGRTVAVESGSNGDLELRKRGSLLANMRVSSFATIDLALEAVRLDKADAAVADAVTALAYAHRNTGMVTGDPFTDEEYGVVARSSDNSMMDAINRAIEGLDREGYLDALQAKWLR